MEGGVSAAGPGVSPGGAGADGSSSEGESSSPIRGSCGGPGGSLSSRGEKHPRERWGCSARSRLRRRSLCPPGPAPAQPKGLLAMWRSRMAGAEAGADEGVSWVVSPPFPAVTVPAPACHQPGTTRGAGRRAGSHPAWQPCKVSSMGTRARVTQPLPGRVSKPKLPRDTEGVESRLAPAGPVLQGPSRSTPGTARPPRRCPRTPHGLRPFPGAALPLPARGGLIGMGIFAPGPGPGFILSRDICAEQAEHAAFIC